MSPRVPDHARVQKPSVYGSLYVPVARERDADAHVERLVFVFGRMPHLPPPPPSFGVGSQVPDRRAENGIPVPVAGTRRSW